METLNEAKLETPAALSFIFAGNATFTMRSTLTGVRYTYVVREAKRKPGKFFVSVLTGPENETNYHYFGSIYHKSKFYLYDQSGFTMETPSVKAFAWVFGKLVAGVEPNGLEIWHAGKCGRCGRKLTVPESIQMGLGPECATKGF